MGFVRKLMNTLGFGVTAATASCTLTHSNQIVVRFTESKSFKNDAGQEFAFAKDEQVAGIISIEQSDGPRNERLYEAPSFYLLNFTFEYAGRKWSHLSYLCGWDLLARDGECVTEVPLFQESSGPGELHDLLDDRSDWSYLLPDGTQRTIRRKLMDTRFDVVPTRDVLLVECTHYDASDFADYRVINYAIPWERLIFLPAPKLYLDKSGNVQDCEMHQGGYVDVR